MKGSVGRVRPGHSDGLGVWEVLGRIAVFPLKSSQACVGSAGSHRGLPKLVWEVLGRIVVFPLQKAPLETRPDTRNQHQDQTNFHMSCVQAGFKCIEGAGQAALVTFDSTWLTHRLRRPNPSSHHHHHGLWQSKGLQVQAPTQSNPNPRRHSRACNEHAHSHNKSHRRTQE